MLELIVKFKRRQPFHLLKGTFSNLFLPSTALVSRKFVVTAGHCVSRAKLREIIIYLGELDTQNSGLIYEPLPAEKHSVVQKFVHPRFRFRLTQPDRFDVAALKLRKPAGYK
jgi:hypothetical protein